MKYNSKKRVSTPKLVYQCVIMLTLTTQYVLHTDMIPAATVTPNTIYNISIPAPVAHYKTSPRKHLLQSFSLLTAALGLCIYYKKILGYQTYVTQQILRRLLQNIPNPTPLREQFEEPQMVRWPNIITCPPLPSLTFIKLDTEQIHKIPDLPTINQEDLTPSPPPPPDTPIALSEPVTQEPDTQKDLPIPTAPQSVSSADAARSEPTQKESSENQSHRLDIQGGIPNETQNDQRNSNNQLDPGHKRLNRILGHLNSPPKFIAPDAITGVSDPVVPEEPATQEDLPISSVSQADMARSEPIREESSENQYEQRSSNHRRLSRVGRQLLIQDNLSPVAVYETPTLIELIIRRSLIPSNLQQPPIQNSVQPKVLSRL